ncbi:MAG: hypothetical protein ACR2GW_07060 [Pyrinomonadaceae bacterium]|jgi:hypothetical protein
MDFNANKEWSDYLYALRTSSDPNKIREEKNKQRIQRVEKAKRYQPIILPLKFIVPVAAQVNPLSKQTPKLNYDVQILGAVSDLAEYGLNIRSIRTEDAFAFVGTDPVTYALVHDWAGWGANAAADVFKGVMYWPIPFDLVDGDRLIVDLFKQVASGAIAYNYFAFVGSRIFGANSDEAKIPAADKTQIETLISARRTPQERLITMPVKFKGGGVAADDTAPNMRTPEQREPLLIRGARTTLRYSRVTMKLEGEAEWMPEPAPIWSLANYSDNQKEVYHWFENPFLLPAGQQLVGDFINNLDDDAAAFDGNGQITFVASTV